MDLLKVLWVLASVGVLATTLYLYDPRTGRDADLILVYGMLLLAFPSGFFVAALFALLATLTPIVDANYGPTVIAVIWLAFAAAGYVQWFKFLPWVVRKWRARL